MTIFMGTLLMIFCGLVGMDMDIDHGGATGVAVGYLLLVGMTVFV